MNNSDYRRFQKDHWPERSKERFLAGSGHSSILDALKAKLESKDLSASQSMDIEKLDNKQYVEMKMIIQEIGRHHEAYDKLDDATRQRLGRIPINSIDDARFWRDVVMKEISKLEQ